MMEIDELAVAAVALLGRKAVEAVGGEVGKRLIGKLWQTVKAKLSGRDALAEYEATPEDDDAQEALRLQLKKALAVDPTLKAQILELVSQIGAKGGQPVIQHAIAVESSKVTQIVGERNVVQQ